MGDKTLKILHLNASSSGGAFIVANRLSNALNQLEGVESKHLVFSGQSGENYSLWADSWFKKKWAFFLHALEKLHFLFFEKNKGVRFAFSTALTGIDITKNKLFKEADVVHLHWINKGFINKSGLEKIIGSKKKVVWTLHDMWLLTGGCYHPRGCEAYAASCGNCPYLKNPSATDISFQLKTKKQQWIQNSSLNLVFPSAWLQRMAKQAGCNIRQQVIPNLMDEKIFIQRNKSALRKKYQLADSDKIVLFISANLSNKYKGFEEFLAVMKLLEQKEINHLKFLVIGSRWADNNANIQFAGYVNDPETMSEYYNLADVYVSSSLEENLPTTVMESIACGTPVVAFDVGGTEEIIEDKNGMVVPTKDKQKMAEAIYTLLSEERKSSIQLAERFAKEQILQKHLNVYKEI